MIGGLRREIEFLIFWFCFLLIVGAVFEETLIMLFIGMVAYIGWTLYNLKILTQWLTKPSKNLPEVSGVWGDVYYHLYHLNKRNRKAKKKLTSMLARFQKSTQALPYATIVLNSIDEIEWFNPAAQHMFNFHPKRDIGQRINNLIRQPEFTSYLLKRKFKKPLEFQYEQQKLQLGITPYGSGQFLLSARDVTQARRLEEMRRDFISNASHELRTPITVMSGYIEMLRETETDSTRMPLEKIQAQTRRMEDIISELIDLAKLESAAEIEEPVPIDSGRLLNEVFQEAVSLDQGAHMLSISVEPIELLGKYDELRMAFSNLLTNAIRYTPQGKAIEFYTSVDETGVKVCVKDQGIGIEYEHIHRLTERFYRVDEGRSREKGGTGLGLSIVKQVLERHGASLRVESTPGRGSVFCCYFPSVELAEQQEVVTKS